MLLLSLSPKTMFYLLCCLPVVDTPLCVGIIQLVHLDEILLTACTPLFALSSMSIAVPLFVLPLLHFLIRLLPAICTPAPYTIAIPCPLLVPPLIAVTLPSCFL